MIHEFITNKLHKKSNLSTYSRLNQLDVFPTVHHSIGYFLEPNLMHLQYEHVCHIILDMFRALTCPSSGGTTAQTQHLVSSLY